MLKIIPAQIEGFDKASKLQIEYVIDRLNTVLNKRQCGIKIAIDYHRKNDGNYGFDQTNDSTTTTMFRFMSGAERGSVSDGVWQAKIHAYHKRFTRAVAYTNIGEEEIYINMAKYDLWDELALVETLIHEYCHLVGMVHSFRRSNLWPTTAPYAIGKMIAEFYANEYKIKPKAEIEFKPSVWGRVKSFFGRVF